MSRTQNASPAPPDEAALARALFHSAPAAIYHSDIHGNLSHANPEYRRIFGLSPEQSLDDWAQALHPEDRARMEATWADFCQRPRPMQFEYRTMGRDGAVRFITEQVTPAEGVTGFVGTISDFTDLVTAREALSRQQGLLEAVVSELPLALLACDAAGNITHYNRAAVELFRIEPYNPSAADSSNPFLLAADTFLADGVRPAPRESLPLARALRGEGVDQLELVVSPHDASPPRAVLSNARRLAGPAGETLGAVAVIQDTTERKQRERELERVHKELMSASRQAGMAEVATNVLHNVGNILNSVNISASLVAERLRQSKASGVSRLAALLLEQGAEVGQFMAGDERGKRVPEYLAALGEQLLADQRMALEEIAALRGHLEHIKDTVAMQQSYAKLCGVTEVVEVADLVEDSLRLNAGALVRHGVTLKREFGAVAPITVDKHKVLQILVNLVRNAKHACDESGRTDKTITLRVEALAHGVRIAVIDNGVGIAAQNMPRLFGHGFTTRPTGHGFGLHSSALAAQELAGTLRAESAGPGEGASFILELPSAPPTAART